MTPRAVAEHRDVDDLVRRVRSRVVRRAGLRSAAWAVAAGGVVTVALVWLDLLVAPDLRAPLLWLPAIGIFAALVHVTRTHRSATRARVTRLVDERSGLGNLLSTYQSPNADGPVAEAFRRRAIPALRSVDPARVVRLEGGRPWGWAAASAVAALVSVLITAGAAGPGARADADAASARGGATSSDASTATALPTLGTVTVRIAPPAYADLPTETSEGVTISALPGSRVRISGTGSARGAQLAARVAGGATLTPVPGSDGWAVEWVLETAHRGVSIEALTDGGVVEQRVLPIRLVADRAPRVTLLEPDGDLVLAAAQGSILVRARALDDYGVGDLTLHWVHSRGSGESFDFSEGTWPWDNRRPVAGGSEAEYSIPLPDLDLAPGDVIHVRATATDRNDVTGPGVGVSATRQIRISRDEDLADITTLIGFPIEREREPLLSQRMIILLTEELRDTARTLTRLELLAEAESIADEQARLRGRVGEQIFSRATGAFQDPESHLDFDLEHGADGEHEPEVFLDELEAAAAEGPVIDPETGIATIANVEIMAHDHDSDPIVAINRSLLTIYNHMWDAERALRSAELDSSLIPQNLALDLLQELRESERVFPRGRVAIPPIDVDAVRGSGEVDDADPANRSAGAPARPVTDEVIGILDDLLSSDPIATGRAAAVRISGLALDLLGVLDDPSPSEALVRAAAAAESDDAEAVRAGISAALTELRGTPSRLSSDALSGPSSFAAARYAEAERASESTGEAPSVETIGTPAADPFVFATARYTSGDWDSAPLVPSNLIHSLAQYTGLPVQAEGVIVDLSSEDLFDYPFLYLTGHLPVFFDEAESRNLTAFVERGGFVFIDDHNHDIDGAFHRSVTSELQRLFGQGRLTPIPNDHELYSAFFSFPDGPPITGHELSGWGDGLIHRELFQIEVDGRIGVLYSNKDYSSEWSYHAENKRFLAIDNTRFGVNILIYALTR